MESLTLLPAVDVKGGQAVQLVQGVDGTEKVFGDPVAAARRWADAGAEWIHLVDLDAAFGHGSNAETIAEAREIAERIVTADPHLEAHPLLRSMLASLDQQRTLDYLMKG